MRIAIIGAGYVGLISSVIFAKWGHHVRCVDYDTDKINALKRKEPIIYEYGLEEALQASDITFSTEYSVIADVDAIFIAVDTPSMEDGTVNVEKVFDVVGKVVEYSDALVIIKSTVPPGTTEMVKSYIRERGYKNEVAVNPEFLREGVAIQDFLHPDRIVVGTDGASEMILREIYAYQIKAGVPFVVTTTTTAELIKYTSNSFLAMKVAFANEMANVCEAVGADIKDLFNAAGLDKRIGKSFLNPGPGFGGSCFPKDTLGIISLASSYGVRCDILEAVVESNKSRFKLMSEKIKNIIGGGLVDKTLAIWGVTYKAGTDDVRSSPAIEIIKLLMQEKCSIRIYDPRGMKNASSILPEAIYCESMVDACRGSDCLVVLTEWDDFRTVDLDVVLSVMKSPIVVDLRNIWDIKEMRHKCAKYSCVGSA